MVLYKISGKKAIGFANSAEMANKCKAEFKKKGVEGKIIIKKVTQ